MVKIKNGKLKMYDISTEYKKYLLQFDKRVSLKDNRKFYGILVTKGSIDYYIPFTSKIHKKTNSKLTVNIKNGGKTIAKLLLNNMIPVNTKDANIADIMKSQYKTYYMNEIRYLHSQKVKNEIIDKINNIFKVLQDKQHIDYLFFRKLCCDFKLLEEKCKEYNKIKLKNDNNIS
jgi:protein AbiQ